MDKIIEISHLSKSYGDIKAVNDLSFSVYHGEIVCISRRKRRRKVHNHFNYVWADKKGQRKNSNLRQRY